MGRKWRGKARKARNLQRCLPFILHPGALAGAGLLCRIPGAAWCLLSALWSSPWCTHCLWQTRNFLICASSLPHSSWMLTSTLASAVVPMLVFSPLQTRVVITSEAFPSYSCVLLPSSSSRVQCKSPTLPCHMAPSTLFVGLFQSILPHTHRHRMGCKCILPSYMCRLFCIPVSMPSTKLLLPASRSLW